MTTVLVLPENIFNIEVYSRSTWFHFFLFESYKPDDCVLVDLLNVSGGVSLKNSLLEKLSTLKLSPRASQVDLALSSAVYSVYVFVSSTLHTLPRSR